MKRLIKMICLLLGILLMLQPTVLNAFAVIRPNAKPAFCYIDEGDNFVVVQRPVREAVPQETAPVPEETQPQETEAAPEATEAAEPEAPAEEKPVRITQAPETFYEVPEYYQSDYPDTLYGNGTIASSGCSITALAMVATYMTEHVYMPDELSGYFGGYIGNNMQRLEYASDQLQLSWRKATNWHDALAALEAGQVVIALMNEGSIFTTGQHYIVLAGMTVDGKIIVNDPYKPNYDNWQLIPGFADGFNDAQICMGFSGAWIYDKSAMPEEPFIYVPEEKEQVECRYPDIQLTQEEKTLLAKLLWLECRGECYEGQQAVAEVILNRLAADNFPDTLKSIIYAEGQFPSIVDMHEAGATQTQYEAIEAALNGPYILPIDVVFYAKFKVNDNFWGQIGQHYFCYQYNWVPEEEAVEETVPETTAEPTAEPSTEPSTEPAT